MDQNQSEKYIRLTWVISLIGIVAALVLPFLETTFPMLREIHIWAFFPWHFGGVDGLYILVIASILTIFVYMKSRAASALLLVVYFYDKLGMLISLHGFTPMFIVIWLIVNLIYIFIIVQGIRATFALHHLKKERISTN